MKDFRMVDTLTDDDEVLDDNGTPVPASVVVLHNNMIKALRKEYPAFADHWHITVDTRGGIVQVRNLALSGDFGFVLHITKIDPEMRRVRKEAGELLERFNVLRGRALAIRQAMRDVEVKDNLGTLKHED